MDDSRRPTAGGDSGASTEIEAAVTVASQRTESASSRPPRAASPELPDRGRALGGGIAVGDVIGGFVVEDKLGEGGMGRVFAAHDPMLDRRVALKLVHAQAGRGESQSTAQLRLLREAQAMARVSHPNVVTVHDVGTHGAQVFLAMEWVDGDTVDRWAEGRGWREILTVFRAAGQGLAAAHRADLVHRDFKPSNLLVGRDGRARVCDFGLASLPATTRLLSDGEDGVAQRATSVPADASQAGTIIGTPNYMAPEQFRGAAPDPRSDQFNFCVALWELLYQARPFAGERLSELADNVTAGRLEQPPSRHGVPARLHAALSRGLAPEPDRRFANLEGLLAALEPGPVRAWRRLGIAAAGLVAIGLVVLAVAMVRGGARPVACSAGNGLLDGVWDPEAAEAMRAVFAATGHPQAGQIHVRVAAALDRYGSGWVEARQAACETAWFTGPHVLDQRMHCLDRRLAELGELVGFLRDQPGREGVSGATASVAGLGPVSQCRDVIGLLAATALPPDPAKRAHHDDLDRRLARAQVLHRASRNSDAIALAAAVVDEARGLVQPDLLARALYQLGAYHTRGGDSAKGEDALREALLLAGRVRDDLLISRITIELMWNLGGRQGKYETALALRTTAEAAMARIGDPPGDRAEFFFTLGSIERSRGLQSEARDDFERGLAIAEAALPDQPITGSLLDGLGLVATDLAEYEVAEKRLQQALALWQRVLGADSIGASDTLNSLGSLASSRGNYQQAIDYYDRALAIKQASYGDDHRSVAMVLNNLGAAYGSLGRALEARAHYQRALAIWEKVLPPDHPDLALALHNLGAVTAEAGDLDAAIGLFQRALDISRAARGDSHYLVGSHLLALGEATLSRGEPDRAIGLLDEAVTILEKSLGAEHPFVAIGLTVVGKCELARHRPAVAVSRLERALAIHQKHPSDPSMAALAQFTLARALWPNQRSRGRARELALAAQREWQTTPERTSEELLEVTSWLAARAP